MQKFFDEDTIAAISTAVSQSGIGVIRISGRDAVRIADKVYRSPGGKKHLNSVPSHTIHYGYIIDPEGQDTSEDQTESEDQTDSEGQSASETAGAFERKDSRKASVIDEVLVSVMLAPRTYTAEDVVEISCHGGVLAVTRVLDAVIKAGARAAGPGEFTKRAFMNGRIDLTEAEAVMDVIESKNRYALENSVSQVRGSLYHKIEEIRSGMLYQSAHIEACLDNPDAMSFEEYQEEFADQVRTWTSDISRLLSTADSGRLMQEGIRTVIVGKPNAGKSSLLNLLLGEERAIVTPVAGTTRDVLTETVTVGGMTLRITDTAGIRDTDDLVEKIGVQRALDAVKEADLVLYLIDSSTYIDMMDNEIMDLIRGKNVIILQNKTDLDMVTDIETIRDALKGRENIPVIPFSARERKGLDLLTDTLKDMFFRGHLSFNDEIVITNARHKALLGKALERLTQLQKSIDDGMPEDFFTVDLMSAYESLGEITGQEIGDDLADEIFSRFCMGK